MFKVCSGTRGRLRILLSGNTTLILLGIVRLIGTSVLFGHYHLHLLSFASECFVLGPVLAGASGLLGTIHGLIGNFWYFPKRKYTAYATALCVIATVELGSLGIFYLLRRTLSSDFLSSVNSARELESYALDETVSSRWDSLHRRYKCCGAHTTGNGYTDWNKIRLGSVPDSCCVNEYAGCGSEVFATTNDQKIPIEDLIYVRGCLTVLRDTLHVEISPIILSLALLTLLSALIEIFLVLFTSCIIRFLKRRSRGSIYDDEEDAVTEIENMDEMQHYSGVLNRSESYKPNKNDRSGISIAPHFRAEESPEGMTSPERMPPRKRGFCSCVSPAEAEENFTEIPLEDIPNQIRLKELSDWEAMEREEMLMSVLDSVMMSRKAQSKNEEPPPTVRGFPVRMIPLTHHPSRFEYRTAEHGTGDGLKCFDFLNDEKYNYSQGSNHPPINRVTVKETRVPILVKASSRRFDELNHQQKNKRVNFGNFYSLPDFSESRRQQRSKSDIGVPEFEGKDVASLRARFEGLAPNSKSRESVKRKRYSLPSNIVVEKPRNEITSEYLTADYEESIKYGESSARIVGKTRRLSEVASDFSQEESPVIGGIKMNLKNTDGKSFKSEYSRLSTPPLTETSVHKEEIVEEITFEEETIISCSSEESFSKKDLKSILKDSKDSSTISSNQKDKFHNEPLPTSSSAKNREKADPPEKIRSSSLTKTSIQRKPSSASIDSRKSSSTASKVSTESAKPLRNRKPMSEGKATVSQGRKTSSPKINRPTFKMTPEISKLPSTRLKTSNKSSTFSNRPYESFPPRSEGSKRKLRVFSPEKEPTSLNRSSIRRGGGYGKSNEQRGGKITHNVIAPLPPNLLAKKSSTSTKN